MRAALEWHADHLTRLGAPPPPYSPPSFDFRSIRHEFSVWGWNVRVNPRAPREFLTLWDATADGVTVSGSGTVTITTPPLPNLIALQVAPADMEILSNPRFSPEGRATFTLQPGRSGPTDEHAGSTGLPGHTNDVRITFLRA